MAHTHTMACVVMTTYVPIPHLLHDCCATMIYVADRAGIVIYNKRKAVDESLAKGWWPVTPNANVTGLAPGKDDK